MRMAMCNVTWLGLLALVGGTALGCRGGSTAANPPPTEPVFVIEPIQIESVELVRNLDVPSGLGVHVKGVVGDGCSELLPLRQLREGSTVSITLERRRPENAICTQIARIFDDVIPLEGAFPPGTYVVRVNREKIEFSVP
jgi:hypothetical protein